MLARERNPKPLSLSSLPRMWGVHFHASEKWMRAGFGKGESQQNGKIIDTLLYTSFGEHKFYADVPAWYASLVFTIYSLSLSSAEVFSQRRKITYHRIDRRKEISIENIVIEILFGFTFFFFYAYYTIWAFFTLLRSSSVFASSIYFLPIVRATSTEDEWNWNFVVLAQFGSSSDGGYNWSEWQKAIKWKSN